jgi:hypothetical protein
LRTIIDDAWVQVISAARPEWIFPFTGLTPAQFGRLVRVVAERGGDSIADGRAGNRPSTSPTGCCWWRPIGART